MPKEMIHFTVAERTAARLKDTRFHNALATNIDGLLLGSIFHDALFYAVLPKGKRLEKHSHVMHGANGEDTYSIVRLQMDLIASSQHKNLSIATLVGIISHIFADTVMHPFVWHFTGNYYDNEQESKTKARQQHRALESLMDMIAAPEKIRKARYRISTMLRRCPDFLTHGLPVDGLAKQASMITSDAEKQLRIALRLFAFMQSLLPNPLLSKSLYAIRPYLPNYVAELGMLFYCPQLLDQASAIEGEISFKHPVTGEQHTASLESFMDDAAERAAEFCQRIEPIIFDEASWNIAEAGPSMDAGISNTSTDSMRYFRTPPFPDLP